MGATALTRYASPAAGYFASVNQAKKGIESMKHYKNLGKRVLSLFVAFVLCVSLVPGAAFAAGESCQHIKVDYLNNGDSTHDIVCSDCHKVIVQKETHDWQRTYDPNWSGKPQKWSCTKCEETIRNIAIMFNSHNCNGYENPNENYRREPTCTESGEYGSVCRMCGKGDRKQIPALGHLYGGGKYDRTNEGHRLLCDRCGEPEQENFDPHSYATGICVCGKEHPSEHQTKLMYTATEPDYVSNTHWFVCTEYGCDYRSAEESHVQLAEPVEEGGYKYWKCACGYVMKSESVPVEPEECIHDFVLDAKESETGGPACGAKKYVYYCTNCQQRKTEYTGGNAHDPDTNVWVKLNDQKHAHPCLYCEKPLNRYADVVKDHSGWTVVETIAPTCTADGYTIEKCADCEATRKNVVPAAHQWSEKLKQKGTDKHGYQCEVCDEWKDVEDHSFNESDDTCICGLKNPKPVEPTEPKCEHQGTLLRWIDNKDGKTHAVLCNGCWTTIDEAAAHAWENDVCKFCHAKKTETPKPDECKHYLNTVPEQAPTCTEDGMKKHLKCSKCGKVFEAGAATAPNPVETTVEALTINKLSHDLTTTVVEATCTSKGSETTTCTRCGYSEKKELPMIAHTRKDVAANAATCTEEGNVAYWTCEVCNKNFTGSGTNSVEITDVTTPALGHDWVEDGKTDSTCSDKGNQHYTCSRCDAVKDEVIDPTGHTPETIAAKTPTCTETGLTEGSKCSVCDAIIEEQETVPALGHDIVTDEAVPATCTGTGLTEGSHCSRCDDAAVAQEVVAALGHDWDNGVVSTAATCDSAGVRTHTCQREGCGETETRAISALGHSAVSYANVAATCTTVGYTGGSYCSRCSAVITARTTVPATGHAWNAGVITTYPTYYSTGLRTYTCATCAATRTETIPQLTYTYDPGYTDPDPDPDPDYQPPVSSNRQPTTTIPDDNTPLGNTPNTPTVTIEDEDTPLANRPLPFIDVASGDWFRPYVSFVYGKGMMTGMSDTLFGPNVSTTRGMIVTIIYRMENASATGVSPFTDVERDEYYADPISWASDNGVVLGYSETLFGPKDNITREQMAAILYRYCVSKGIDVANYGDLSRFPDGDKVSDYAVEAMRWAVDRGLIAGMDDGRLDPTGTATRAQVATILNRFCEMIGA